MKPRQRFTTTFRPLEHTMGPGFEVLSELIDNGHLDSAISLELLRQREHWAITLPIGAFVNDFRPGIVSFEQDNAKFEEILAKIRASFGYRPWRMNRSIIEREGQRFYHQKMIDLVRRHAEQPAFLDAIHTFLQAVGQNPKAIIGETNRRPFVPPDQRVAVFGHNARGPAWTPEEDQILRQWFGIRTVGADAGHHAKLTETEWAIVLERLGNRRTRGSIRQRISTLNQATLARYCVNGYVPRDRVRAYMQEALGEQPRYPRITVAVARRASRPRTEDTSAPR